MSSVCSCSGCSSTVCSCGGCQALNCEGVPPLTGSSHYDFQGTPWNRNHSGSQTWIYAAEARQQTSNAPSTARLPYPSTYLNQGIPLPLRATQPLLHHPLIPGQSTAWAPYQTGHPRLSIGGVRTVYNGNNQQVFDVMYHDPTKGVSARGNAQFSVAPYVPRRREGGQVGGQGNGGEGNGGEGGGEGDSRAGARGDGRTEWH